MLGSAAPYFTLIFQSPNRVEVEKAALAYEKDHHGIKVIIDHLKDHLDRADAAGLWRARVWITVKRTLWQRLMYSLSR